MIILNCRLHIMYVSLVPSIHFIHLAVVNKVCFFYTTPFE